MTSKKDNSVTRSEERKVVFLTLAMRVLRLGITFMQVGAVNVLWDLRRNFFPDTPKEKENERVPIIVYRLNENTFNIFNYEVKLIGSIRIAKEDEIIKYYGKEWKRYLCTETGHYNYSHMWQMLRKKWRRG